MELNGRIDEDGEFLIFTDKGERLCVLFTSAYESDDEDEFDLSGYPEGPVTAKCESFDGADAWGVTAVDARVEQDA